MGRKSDEIRKRKEENEKLRRDELLRRTEELGLGFTDHELPPEEMEQQSVNTGLTYSFLSMIPYTTAWYETKASELEMDDLAKIRIERARAQDFLAMTRMNRHDEALAKMMEDTNNDFFYFNKLKHRLSEEGKYKYPLRKRSPFEDIGHNKNRLRRALHKEFSIVGASDVLNLGACVVGAHARSAAAERAARMAPCSWRYEISFYRT